MRPSVRSLQLSTKLHFVLAILSALLIGEGCGGSNSPVPGGSGGGPSGPPNISGNWEFTTNAAPNNPIYIGGALTSAGATVTATFQVWDLNPAPSSGCVIEDGVGDVFTGSINDQNSISLSANLATVGSVTATFSLSGSLSSDGQSMTGVFMLSVGSCGIETSGMLTGAIVPSISGSWSGSVTWPDGSSDTASGNITQSEKPNSDGSYNITGNFTFGGGCVASATILNSEIWGAIAELTLVGNDGSQISVGSATLPGGTVQTPLANSMSLPFSITQSTSCTGRGQISLNRT